MINEYGRRIMVWDDRGYRPATPAEVEGVTMANGKLSVCCVEGHLMTEANTYRATIGGYPRRFCRTCKRGRKADDKRLARQRGLDKTNPTFPRGHSARSDRGNKWVHAGRYICLPCSLKRSVARHQKEIKWLREVNDPKVYNRRYVRPALLELEINGHEQQIAVDEEHIARLERVTI